MPSLIDRYISRLYVRVAGLSFLALLGLFYISTFIDRSDKIFKGQATTAMIGELLILLTPQFIYYVIPIAALLSALVTYGLLARSSELTVMKACGISLYRTALSVVVLSLAMSVVLFGLEQRLMASANRQAEALDARIRGRQPRTLNLLNRRWVVGSDKVIYHYGLFDPQRNEMFGLTMFTPRPGPVGAELGDVRPTRDLPRQRLDRRERVESGFQDRSSEVDHDRSAVRSRGWSRPTTLRPSLLMPN